MNKRQLKSLKKVGDTIMIEAVIEELDINDSGCPVLIRLPFSTSEAVDGVYTKWISKEEAKKMGIIIEVKK